jgi:hypothetical protein
MNFIQVSVVKVSGYRVRVPEGWAIYSGWAVADANGALFSVDGKAPYCWKRKEIAEEVARDGLMPAAKFAPPQSR